MGRKVVIAGGSGFLGQALSRRFQAADDEVVLISRSVPKEPGKAVFRSWNGETRGDWVRDLERADLLINLAGRSVNCRYNEKNRGEILDSRVKTTALLGRAVEQCGNPPKLWINASTATIYRDASDRPMDEFSGEIGSGFSVGVAQSWEKTFFEAEAPHTHKLALRISIVLGSDGGALPPFRNLAKCGLGGAQGNGRQMFSWIHEEDVFKILRFAEGSGLNGAVNCTSPNPVTNLEFMRTLRKAVGIPFGLPAPRFALEIGAFLLRTESELLLKSRWVMPERLLRAGFRFKHPELPEALANLLSKARPEPSA